MNAVASSTARAARYTSRRCLSVSSNSHSLAATTSAGRVATSFRPLATSSSSSLELPLSPWSCFQQQFLSQYHYRLFSSDSGGGKDGETSSTITEDTSSQDETSVNDSESAEESPAVVVANDDAAEEEETYDPADILHSFRDTSYYYPPPEETDPNFLAQKYEGLTNEELLDSSTIADPEGTHTWETLMHSPPIRDKNAALPKGTLVGTVVSTKMQKTVNVAVDRYKVHPKYRKRIRYTRKFMAHDEHEVASDGDLVVIVPSQRISKKKHFVLREILKAKGQL